MLPFVPLALRMWDGLCPGIGPVWTSFWSSPTPPSHLVPSQLFPADPLFLTLSPPWVFAALPSPAPCSLFAPSPLPRPSHGGSRGAVLRCLPPPLSAWFPDARTRDWAQSDLGQLCRACPWGLVICLFKDSAVQPGGGPFRVVSQPRTVGICDGVLLCCGASLCAGGSLAASLASVH